MIAPRAPRLVVTIGTDHHPFRRLMQWVEELIERDIVPADHVLVQSGRTPPPATALARTVVPRDELLALMASADVVVGHGGPGTIMDARSMGRRPVIVPRLARWGEVVDDHQVAFSRHLAARDMIVLAEDRDAFVHAVRRGLADPRWLRLSQQAGEPAASAQVAQVARHIDQVVQQVRDRPRPSIGRRVGELWRAYRGARTVQSDGRVQPKSRAR